MMIWTSNESKPTIDEPPDETLWDFVARVTSETMEEQRKEAMRGAWRFFIASTYPTPAGRCKN